MGFNTSHVTLYHDDGTFVCEWADGFNTSHVTLYQDPEDPDHRFIVVSIHLMLLFIGHAQIQNAFNILFQYISCYSLSQKRFSLSCFCTGFQYISCYSLSLMVLLSGFLILSFNTSHVTLYRTLYCQNRQSVLVSIHLMLLFISSSKVHFINGWVVSIHLMLLFIEERY